ncbi:hypothetical protein Tco_0661370 [Tanacetum coccineum]
MSFGATHHVVKFFLTLCTITLPCTNSVGIFIDGGPEKLGSKIFLAVRIAPMMSHGGSIVAKLRETQELHAGTTSPDHYPLTYFKQEWFINEELAVIVFHTLKLQIGHSGDKLDLYPEAGGKINGLYAGQSGSSAIPRKESSSSESRKSLSPNGVRVNQELLERSNNGLKTLECDRVQDLPEDGTGANIVNKESSRTEVEAELAVTNFESRQSNFHWDLQSDSALLPRRELKKHKLNRSNWNAWEPLIVEGDLVEEYRIAPSDPLLWVTGSITTGGPSGGVRSRLHDTEISAHAQKWK